MKTTDQIRAEAEQLAESAPKEYWRDLHKRHMAAMIESPADLEEKEKAQ